MLLRGHKVLLDSALADLYGEPVKALNQAVRRNRQRFPQDFMFQLTTREAALLRSQIVTLKTGRGAHRKYRPYAFTEQGVAMLSSVLHSARAVRVNIEIMRAFVRLRQMLASRNDRAQEGYGGSTARAISVRVFSHRRCARDIAFLTCTSPLSAAGKGLSYHWTWDRQAS